MSNMNHNINRSIKKQGVIENEKVDHSDIKSIDGIDKINNENNDNSRELFRSTLLNMRCFSCKSN